MEVLREAAVLKRAGLLSVAVQGSRSEELVVEAAKETCLRYLLNSKFFYFTIFQKIS